ncbi:MAG: hypothetical protein JXA15_02340 [Spirochaetales bacterium]|nr:hypothetical protein [Spirochaetales bacterium]
MGIVGDRPIALSPGELVALYLQLRAHESDLDRTVSGVLDRIRRILYEGLSIDEMEHLEDYYSILQAADRTALK